MSKTKAFTGSNELGVSRQGTVDSGDQARLLKAQAFTRPDRIRQTLLEVAARLTPVGAKVSIPADNGAGSPTSSSGAAAAAAAAADADGMGELVALLDKMALFLESPITRGILFRPIARKVASAAADCRAIIALLMDPDTVVSD